MAEPLLNPLKVVAFDCRACKHKWRSPPEVIEPAEHLFHHPWEYFCHCPECEQRCGQSAWQKAWLKGRLYSTGPKTAKGRAQSRENIRKATATPRDKEKQSFAQTLHGRVAKYHKFFPARPGVYLRCKGCEYLEDQDCLKPPKVCTKRIELLRLRLLTHRIELLTRYEQAFMAKEPERLMDVHAENQARMQILIEDMFLAIEDDGGPRIKEPVYTRNEKGKIKLSYFRDKDGKRVLMEEIKPHPLMKTLMEYIKKSGITMEDIGMTPKKYKDIALEGYLSRQDDRQEALLDYQARQAKALEAVKEVFQRSARRLANDPVLIEHEANEVSD